MRRWAQLDPGNGTPWLEIIRQAWQAGAVSAEADAWAHLAAAVSFDGYKYAAARAVLRHASGRPEDDAAANDLASRAVPMNTVSSTLFSACRRRDGVDDERLAQCRTIGNTMFEHSDEQSLRSQGANITFVVTGDPTRRDIARDERLRGLALQSRRTATSPCELQRSQTSLRLRSAQVGEVVAMHEAASAPSPR